MHERKAEREQLEIVETGELLKLAAASRLQGEGRTYTVYIVYCTVYTLVHTCTLTLAQGLLDSIALWVKSRTKMSVHTILFMQHMDWVY